MRALLLAGLATALSLQAQPKVQTFTLPNGLRVLHLEDHERPLVRALFFVNIAPTDVPPGHQGLPLLSLRMFSHSDAADLKAEDLHRLLEDSGITFTQAVTPVGFEWRFAARSRDQDRALGLLADRLQRTLFDPADLETQRLACWRQVERQADNPQARLRQALAQGPDTKPTFTSLSSIGWDDLLVFRARVFRPDHALLVLHCDLGLEQAKRLVLLNLGTWTAQTVPPHSDTSNDKFLQSAAPPNSTARISTISPALRLQAVADQPTSLAEETAQLLALLVPGQASLIPIQIEAEPGRMVATLDSNAELRADAAWTLFHGRLETLCQRGFTQSELDLAKAVWLKGQTLASLHPDAQMDAALAEARGRGVTAERIQAVSLDTLNADLRRWLAPANLRTGAVGTPDALRLLPKP
jgi:predicted Zn-dependent peptidase